MTDRKLHRLSRSALIELLIEQMEENERLEAELAEANQKLMNRDIAIQNAGSIAEASLSLNHVFSAAEKAAAQYLDNIKSSNQRCNDLIQNAEQEAAKIIQAAKKRAGEIGVVVKEPEILCTPPVSKERLDQRFDSVFAQMRRRNK